MRFLFGFVMFGYSVGNPEGTALEGPNRNNNYASGKFKPSSRNTYKPASSAAILGHCCNQKLAPGFEEALGGGCGERRASPNSKTTQTYTYTDT